MARPSPYDWKSIEADFKAGLTVDKICRKHTIEKKTLQNKIYDKKWEVSGNAKAIMKGLEQVSGNLGQLQAEEPEILDAVYDRIKTESEFDVSAGSLAMKIMKGLHTVVDNGKSYERVNVGNGVQNLEPIDMGASHYLDVANAAYRAKELLKGKEMTSSQNINVNATAAVQNNIDIKNIPEDELKEMADRYGIILER